MMIMNTELNSRLRRCVMCIYVFYKKATLLWSQAMGYVFVDIHHMNSLQWNDLSL